MKNSKWGMLALMLVLGFGLVAGADWKNCKHSDKEASREVPAQKAWGKALGENLKISVWDAKKEDQEVMSMVTSREVFGLGFAVGGKKGGMALGLGGRILPQKNGKYEVLLAIEFAGGKGKGGLGVELQSSVIVKKGKAKAFSESKDSVLMVKVETAD